MDPQFPVAGASRHDQSHQQQQQPPTYDITVGGHYGASAALSTSLPSPQLYGGAFANVRDARKNPQFFNPFSLPVYTEFFAIGARC